MRKTKTKYSQTPSNLYETDTFILQYGRLHTLPLQNCINEFTNASENMFVGLKDLNEKFVCTEKKPSMGLCAGDEGSPLIMNNKLIGIASWSIEWNKYPNVFIKVFPYLKWIEELTKH